MEQFENTGVSYSLNVQYECIWAWTDFAFVRKFFSLTAISLVYVFDILTIKDHIFISLLEDPCVFVKCLSEL